MLTNARSLWVAAAGFLTCAAITAALLSCGALLPMDLGGGPSIAADVRLPLADQLRADVTTLATDIGPRNTAHPQSLALAESFIAASLAKAGYAPKWQTYDAGSVMVSNIIAELPGSDLANEIVIIGAHYDSVTYKGVNTPGADDNASGVAATLALARAFQDHHPRRTVRFVLFTNEEPPHFWTDTMGSLVYARDAKARNENIAAMISVECVGYFKTSKHTQDYPPPVGLAYPSTGDFVAFVSFASAEPLVRRCTDSFLSATNLPATGAALPTLVPRIGSSDHWSFWKQGYPSLMVTDTAIHRNKNYHTMTDTPDTLDYESMAMMVTGLEAVITDLANGPAVGPVQTSDAGSDSPPSP